MNKKISEKKIVIAYKKFKKYVFARRFISLLGFFYRIAKSLPSNVSVSFVINTWNYRQLDLLKFVFDPILKINENQEVFLKKRKGIFKKSNNFYDTSKILKETGKNIIFSITDSFFISRVSRELKKLFLNNEFKQIVFINLDHFLLNKKNPFLYMITFFQKKIYILNIQKM